MDNQHNIMPNNTTNNTLDDAHLLSEGIVVWDCGSSAPTPTDGAVESLLKISDMGYDLLMDHVESETA